MPCNQGRPGKCNGDRMRDKKTLRHEMQLPKHRLEKREILYTARSSLPSAKRDTMVESTITQTRDYVYKAS